MAYEGLADWNAALRDYDKAVTLWGGRRAGEAPAKEGSMSSTSLSGVDSSSASSSTSSSRSGDGKLGSYTDADGVNPYVLTFRGNVLTRLVRAATPMIVIP